MHPPIGGFFYDKMERIDLTKIPELETQTAQQVVHGIARDYAQLIGMDFDKILPALKDNSFWEVDYLENSKWGLSLMDAYRCLLDVHRTIQIMGGINETMRNLRAQGKEDIVAIDAGTGTGIFAIYLAALGCKKVYALELNQETADIAKKFIDRSGCGNTIEVVVGDATQIDIPELREKPADILMSENLSGGLFAEPQFQIIRHLSRFLSPNAPIVPYSVELSASLAKGDWEKIDWKDKKPRNNLTARRVPNLSVLTDRVCYGFVTSRVGMDVPRINGHVAIPVQDGALPNTLLISTKFQINEHGNIYVLEPDSAEFLGKTSAIRLRNDVTPSNGMVVVNLDYDTGFNLREKKEGVEVEGNLVKLIGHLE